MNSYDATSNFMLVSDMSNGAQVSAPNLIVLNVNFGP
jgi:hypothetical protein